MLTARGHVWFPKACFCTICSPGHLRDSCLRCLRTCIPTKKQTCEGFSDQVSLCQPIDEGEEYELINTMIDELNSKCGLELSHEVSLHRPAITSKPDRPDLSDDVMERVVIVGGSHSLA